MRTRDPGAAETPVLRKQRNAAFPAVALTTALLGLAACGEGPHVIYGYMDAQGHWVVHPEYPTALEFSEGLAAVEKDGRWGYIGTRGQWIIEARFGTATPFSEGLAAVETDDAWCFINPTGTTVVAGPFDEAHPFFAGLAAVKVGEKWGFVDHEGRMVVAPRFDKTGDFAMSDLGWHHGQCFSEGLCAAQLSDKWGYIDREGGWVIPPRYEEAGAYSEGVAAVREPEPSGTGKVGFIDRTGAWVITPRFEHSLWFSGGRAIAVVTRPVAALPPGDAGAAVPSLTAVMIDAAGREVAEVGWGPLLDVFEGARDVLQVLAPDYLAEGLVPATRDDRWGFMDRKGQWVIEPRFDAVLPFRNGKAAAGMADEPSGYLLDVDRWGVIDAEGRWLIEPILEDIGPVGAATSLANLHGRWGMLDLDGQWRVPPRYAEEPALISGLETQPASGDGLRRVGVHANHTWIVADRYGRKSRPREFAWLTEVSGLAPGSPGTLAFLEAGSWGLADGRMSTVLPAQFDDRPKAYGEFVLVARQGVEACLDTRGRSVALAQCSLPAPVSRRSAVAPSDETERFFMRTGEDSDGRWLSRIKRDELWGLVDDEGREILPARHAEIGDAYDGMVAVRSGAQWRIVDLRGREIFPPRPEELAPFNRDVAIFCDAGLCGLLHRSGQVLTQQSYGAISPLSRFEVAVHRVKPSGEIESTGIVDTRGRLRVPLAYYTIRRHSEGLWLASDAEGRKHLLDRSSGQPIAVSSRLTGIPGALKDGLAAFDLRMPDGSTAAGYLDSRGRIAIEPRFDTGGAEEFMRGAAVVTRNGKCGMIDRRGAILLPLQYDHCERTRDGGVLAGVETRWRDLAGGAATSR